jgi:PAS domain S-box-containing protein
MQTMTPHPESAAAGGRGAAPPVSEYALHESEARFRALIEAVPHLIWVARPDGAHEFFNGRWYDYTGQSRGGDVAGGWRVALHPDDRERSAELWRVAVASGEPFQAEHRLRRADGQYHWYLALAVPQRDAAGRVLRWFGSCTDIDDRRRAEEEAQQNLKRFRVLTEALPQLVFTATAEGEVVSFNRRWVDVTGLTPEVTRDSGWTAAVHPDDRRAALAEWLAAVRVGDPLTLELRLREGASGHYLWHLLSAMPVRDVHDRVVQWVATLTDINDQKAQAETLERLVNERTAALSATNRTLRAEIQEREKAQDRERLTATELRRSNEELEKFAYVASHDLQEPLRKIQAFGDRLRTKSAAALGEQGREYVERMLNSADRMRALINDLLTFSRVSTKPQAVAPVDLNGVVAGVLADLEERVTQTGARVSVGPLPTLEADPLQMRQLFQNLIGNALKFQRPGVAPEVTVVAGPVPGTAEECWRIEVADNGIGFDDVYLDRIFQVFQRLHGRGEYEGTGIGLAVCRKIVERHGGAITARGRPGEGSAFIITLPARQADRGASPDAQLSEVDHDPDGRR